MQTSIAERLPGAFPHRWFLVAIFFLFLTVSVQYSMKAMENRSAFLRWRDQIVHLQEENIYERYNYPNPPIMALLLSPIVALPPLAGALTWFYLKLLMTVVAIAWVLRLVEIPGYPFPEWAKALTVALSLRPIIGDLSHGNVNLFILFLVVGALVALRGGQAWLSGAALALAIACKVTPALFLPYFLWKRAWRALASCAIGMVVFFLIVPGSFLGNERNIRLLRSWADQMVKPFVISGAATSVHENQSLPGLVFRLTTPSPSFLDEKGEPESFNNFLDLSPRTAGWLIKGGMCLFTGIILWCCRTPLTSRESWRLAAEFSLIVLGMLLFSERTWKHHCVTLLLPFAVISYYLAVCHPGHRLRAFLIANLVAVVLLMSSTSTSILDLDAKLAQVYGAYVWAYLLLFVALVVLLRQPGLSRTPLTARTRDLA